MEGQKDEGWRDACMDACMDRREKEQGVGGQESRRGTELEDNWLNLVFHYILGTKEAEKLNNNEQHSA